MTRKRPVTVALLDTRSFSFVAVGRSETEARAAMRAAWDEHRRQTDAGDWSEFADAVQLVELRPGQSARDLAPLADLYG